jgi:hypothetical protein
MREPSSSRTQIVPVSSAIVLLALLWFTQSNADSSASITCENDCPQRQLYQLPANTEIHLRTLDAVASNTHKRGAHFRIETTTPVLIDGMELIGTGVRGEGEVVHADKARFGGRAGELILTARFIQVGDVQVKLKSFTIGVGADI